MIGYISTVKQKIYLPQKEIVLTKNDLKDGNLLGRYPDVKLWLTDIEKNIDLNDHKWQMIHCAKPVTLPEWDIFNYAKDLTPAQIMQAYDVLYLFFPEIEKADGGKSSSNLWQVPQEFAQGFLLENHQITMQTKGLTENVDIVDFLLWLTQQNIILPVANPTEKKMKLKEILTHDLNLALFVKREDIARMLKGTKSLKNKHLESEWIQVNWLLSILYDDLSRYFDYEYTVTVFEKTQGITAILPSNFSLMWLFSPSAHYAFYRFFQQVMANAKKEPFKLNAWILIMGIYHLQKLEENQETNVIVDFDLLKYSKKPIKNDSSKSVGSKMSM